MDVAGEIGFENICALNLDPIFIPIFQSSRQLSYSNPIIPNFGEPKQGFGVVFAFKTFCLIPRFQYLMKEHRLKILDMPMVLVCLHDK